MSRATSVRPAAGEERQAALRRLEAEWGDPILTRGEIYALDECEILVAGDFEGLAAYCLRDKPVAELVAINAFVRRRGIGTALLAAVADRLDPAFTAIRLTTTNDNLDALRFYQRRGYRLLALRPGAVDRARERKPSIPLAGENGIPLRDEIDLILDLPARGGPLSAPP